MAISKKKGRNIYQSRLSEHIESFQDRFRKLPKAAAMKDLCKLLAGVIQEMFPGVVLHIGYRTKGSNEWERIVGTDADGFKHLFGHSDRNPSSMCEVSETEESVVIIQKLVDESILGLAVTGERAKLYGAEIELLTLRLFVHLFDNAYQDMLARRNEKGLVFSLNHRILQLNSLIDTGIEVASLGSNSSPHRLALERAASLTNASKGVARVSKLGAVIEEYIFPETLQSIDTSPANRISTQFTFTDDLYEFHLIEKESRSGIVPFDETDQLLLDALARQVHASLENRYLHQQALEKQRIEQEMKVAASIQQKIIPVSLPSLSGYDIAGKNIPSKSVGGDYYDCFPLNDGRYALVVADVTGKGVPAALLVSSTHAYLSAYFESTSPLSDLVGKLNKALYNASTDDKFVTAFIALLSPESGEIEYSNAGHNPGYIVRNDNTILELKIGGFPLGAFDLGLKYKSEKVVLEKGERLFLYTDGVTEASNEAGEFYEQAVQLPEFLAANKPPKAELFVSGLIADVKRFTGSAAQNDDITALYLYRMP